MTRIVRGGVAKDRRKKILELAKSYRGSHSKLFRTANQQVMKALNYAFSGRKKKKKQIKHIWITRINAIARINDANYNFVVRSLKFTDVLINKKVFSEINLRETEGYSYIVDFY